MDTPKQHIVVIGGGPAGIVAAAQLAKTHRVTLLEKNDKLCNNITNKFKLFPNFADADETAAELIATTKNENITVNTSAEVTKINRADNKWEVTTDKDTITADAVVIATGYDIFDAHRKEELGYGIYPGIITSLELEQMMKSGNVVTRFGDKPRRITFLQCVGSRDAKIGNHYCSKLCCVTAVKQAIELRKISPETEVFLFYMDLRMWGQGFEELYRQSQEEHNVHFVRGRISEAASTYDGRIQIKAEDTLIGQPLKMNTDFLVLMVGMEPSCGTKNLSQQCNISGDYGFAASKTPHLLDQTTEQPGIFLAGSCKRPYTLSDTINDAYAAAAATERYLNEKA
ncbi:MAG: FAD-dependent oxidoreductase [Bacteroidales bacterium]|nr:FAD-dependent oxidoreductase [Bacteroidales bacterium]